jgi:hypothetical protein
VPQLVRQILIQQATHLHDGLRSVLTSESNEPGNLILRDRGIILADLLDGATQFPFFDNLVGGHARTFDQRNTSLFTWDSLHQLATSPIDLFELTHLCTWLYSRAFSPSQSSD